jgi:hypothetical protein
MSSDHSTSPGLDVQHLEVQRCRGLVINAPHVFADPAFRAWLTGGERTFTWMRDGRIDEWSDVVVLVDPGLSGEGSDSDMPAFAWDQIIAACRHHLGPDHHGAAHYMVRLTNLRGTLPEG